MFNYFSFENCAVYEIMWKNIVMSGRLQMIIWSMRVERWIPKAANTYLLIYLLHGAESFLRS